MREPDLYAILWPPTPKERLFHLGEPLNLRERNPPFGEQDSTRRIVPANPNLQGFWAYCYGMDASKSLGIECHLDRLLETHGTISEPLLLVVGDLSRRLGAAHDGYEPTNDSNRYDDPDQGRHSISVVMERDELHGSNGSVRRPRRLPWVQDCSTVPAANGGRSGAEVQR